MVAAIGVDSDPVVIAGIGTDIVATARIAKVYERHGERFLERTYRDAEREYCLAARDPTERLAARWAAKEAVMKALGSGWARGVQFKDIEIARDESGKPSIVLHAAAAELAAAQGIAAWHCSISHADGMAVAYVIAESAV